MSAASRPRAAAGAFAAVALLAACAAAPDRDDALAPWTGAGEAELLRAWGTPAARRQAGDREVLTFEQRRRLHLPSAVVGSSGGGLTETSPTLDLVLSCSTVFELAGGRVVGASRRGSHCAAGPRAPAGR